MPLINNYDGGFNKPVFVATMDLDKGLYDKERSYLSYSLQMTSK